MRHGLKTATTRSLRRKAEAAVRNANAKSDAPPPAEINRLVALSNAGHQAELENAARLLLKRYPNSGFVWKALGVSLQMQGKEALPALQKATQLLPDDAEAHFYLGTARQLLGRLDDAQASYRRSLEINPDNANAHNNLGVVLKTVGRINDALASCQRAVEIKPDFAEAHSNQGGALIKSGRLKAAAVCLRRALEIKPDAAEAHSNLLFCLSHDETVDAQTLFDEHRRFAEQFEAPLRNDWPRHANLREPERCLRIGIVSGDLRRHAVTFFVEPVLARLATYPRLSLHVYYNHTIEDDVTRRLRGCLSHWHIVTGLTDETLAQKIRQDGIDILMDLSGHTAQNRLLTFARKPAPLQVTWIGYPNTTGLQAMDYALKDRFIAPYGAYERYYVEKLVRLPGSGTFLPPKDAPAVNDLPALSTGNVTFGSFNRPGKLGDGVIALWSRVLLAVPGSRLLLGNTDGIDIRANLVERFARCAVAADRLAFRPQMELNDYLALHHQVDFILDSFPYTGGTTTNHALWMGVPVLTLTGTSPMQCQCAGVLRRVGLEDWIADDAEDFLRRAVDWSGRLGELAKLRTGMRERVLSSPMQHPETVARGVEAAFRIMWRRRCEGLPSESFEVEMKDVGAVRP